MPLNTTTLPALSLNTETSAAQNDSKQSTPVSFRSRSSSASDASALLTSVTASSDRRHFYTDHRSLTAVHKGGGVFESHQQTASTDSYATTGTSTLVTNTSTAPVVGAATSATPTSSATMSTSKATSSSPAVASTLLLTESLAASKQPAGIKSYLRRTFWQVCQFLVTLFKASFVPVSNRMVTLLAKEQEKRAPLSNALFCFVTELTSKTAKEPWLCNERLQLGMLSLFGKQLDR